MRVSASTQSPPHPPLEVALRLGERGPHDFVIVQQEDSITAMAGSVSRGGRDPRHTSSRPSARINPNSPPEASAR
jgi:hypothetical protein